MDKWGDQLHSFFEEAVEEETDWELVSPSFLQLQNVDEKYTDPELLGAGALKEVYKCYDQKTRRYIALAKLREGLDKDFYEAFIYEAWLTTSLSHPNIIKVFEVELDDHGRPYFTMDLKANRTLEQVIREGASEEDLLATFLTVCDAVLYAHDRGVIHLDLKPCNIQCDQFGEVLVCDWGLGKYMDLDHHDSAQRSHLEVGGMLTMYGVVQGTPGYMAPEQIHSERPKDERTDIFSLGAILYTIVCGRAPFTGEESECLEMTLKGVSRAELLSASIPKGLVDICAKALSANPEERYQSVRELKQDVKRYSDGYATRAERPDYLRFCYLFLKRHHRSVIALVTFLVLLMAGIGIQQHRVQAIRAYSEQQASTLNDEVEEVTHEYEVFASVMADSQQSLSIKLVRIAHDLVQEALGRTGTPTGPNMVKLLGDAELLFEKALILAPDNRAAAAELFWINAVQMDFKRVLEIGAVTDTAWYERIMHVAQDYPEFQFDADDRPSIDQFERVFLRLEEVWSKDDRTIIEAMLFYQLYSSESDSITQNQCIIAVLNYFNSPEESYSASYQPDSGDLSFSSTQGLVHTSVIQAGSLLSYLNLKTLSLEFEHAIEFDLADLRGIQVDELNLGGVPRVVCTDPQTCDSLSRLILHDREKREKYVDELKALGCDFSFVSSSL